MNYYNEIDPYAAQWIRNLIAAGLIPYGEVDERSIEDIAPADLRGFTQCHFFAGIAGWSHALALAGIPADFPIWTGSCPCQPFSTAGEGAGFADERHLWPAFHWLIAQCRPELVVGEQVASRHADPWIDLVLDDLEALAYAATAVAFPSASVGAPHIRDRTYWVGDTNHARLERYRQGHRSEERQRQAALGSIAPPGQPRRLAYGVGPRVTVGLPASARGHAGQPGVTDDRGGELPCARQRPTVDRLDNADHIAAAHQVQAGRQLHGTSSDTDRTSATNGFWRAADWLACRDGYWRPVEPGTFPLAHGIPDRVGRLRAYGNAINPYQAAEFLRAALA